MLPLGRDKIKIKALDGPSGELRHSQVLREERGGGTCLVCKSTANPRVAQVLRLDIILFIGNNGESPAGPS